MIATNSELSSWPEVIPLRDGVTIDRKLLVWAATKWRRKFMRWTFEELLAESVLVAFKLAARHDESKSKFSSYYATYGCGHLTDQYLEQFVPRGFRRRSTRPAPKVGQIHSNLMAEPVEIVDDSYREIAEILVDSVSGAKAGEAARLALAGLSHPEAAAVMGISKVAAASNYKHAMKQMRQHAQEIGVTSEGLW